MNKVAKNTVYYSIGEIVPKIIGFIMLPIYTNVLSPSDYGIISYTNTITSFLALFGTFCLNTYLLRFYFIHNDENERRRMLGTINLSIISMNCLIILLGFLIMPGVINKYDIQIPWNPFFRLALINNFLHCMTTVPSVIYRVRQDAMRFMFLGVSRTVLVVLLTVYLLVYKKVGVVGTFEAQFVVYLVYVVVYFLIIKKYASFSFNIRFLKEGLRFSLPLLPGTLCYVLLHMSDRVILERNVGIDELGIYNVASTIALALNIVIQSGYKSFEPEFFKRYGKDDYFPYVVKVKNIFFFLIYLSALCICLFSQELFYYMTAKSFYAGYLLVPAIITGVLFSGQNIIYQGILQGERKTKVQGMATMIGAFVNIVLNLIFIPFWGTFAAAFTSAISIIIVNTILFIKMTFPNKKMHKEIILSVVMMVLVYGIFIMFPNVSIIGFVVKIICVCLFGYVTLRFYQVDIENIKVLVLPKIHKK